MGQDGGGSRLLWAAPGSLFVDQVGAAWSEHGPAGLGAVTGPWAVALRDPRGDELVLARDPVGVQPLFWARTTTGVVAASSWLAALADRADVDDRVDYEGVLLTQALEIHDPRVASRTPFAGISAVPPGSLLRVRADGSVRLERYWDPATLAGPDESLTLDDAADLLRERIDAALRRLLPRDGTPVGAHLSGGLDSTALALRADQLLRDDAAPGASPRPDDDHPRRGLAAAYSWAPSDALLARVPGDERALLDEITATHELTIRMRDGEGYAPWFSEVDPVRYPDSSHLFESWTLPQAASDGVRVLLSGWGGDELASYNGYGILDALLRSGRLATAWRETRSAVALRGGGSRPRLAAPARTLAGTVLRQLPAPAHALRHPRQARSNRSRERSLAEALGSASPLALQVRASSRASFAMAGDHHARQVALLTRGHLQHRTTWWYQTGRLFDIDYRYPLLDLGVVEAALQLPWWAFRSGGWDRPAYRRAVSGWVPASVAWRVTKDEPALFDPGAMARLEATGRPRSRPVPDAHYDRVMELAWRTWMDG